jgi:acetyl-CoA carboxylase biotin carboxyl carrier protein
MNLANVKALAELMDAHDLVELEITDSGVRLCKRRPEHTTVSLPIQTLAPAAAASASSHGSAHQGQDASTPKAERSPDVAQFLSPMVGTFYRAPNPEANSYVVEGDRVDENSVLCIIEAMKVMNEIKAEIRGEVIEVLVENGEAVEFGQPLFLIKKMA